MVECGITTVPNEKFMQTGCSNRCFLWECPESYKEITDVVYYIHCIQKLKQVMTAWNLPVGCFFFNDEAYFHLSGYINSKNNSYLCMYYKENTCRKPVCFTRRSLPLTDRDLVCNIKMLNSKIHFY